MRFLHTADWHLGRIFYNLHLTEDQAFVLEQFVDLVKDTQPDAVVIAGDVYDRSVPPPDAVRLLGEVLGRISIDLKVPIVMIAGNHDSPERLGFGDRVLARQQLHVFGQVANGATPLVLEDRYGPVYFFPIPYAEPAVVREKTGLVVESHDDALKLLINQMNALVPANCRRVAVAHAYVGGGEASESERPLSIGGMATVETGVFSPFHYVALGHLHQAQVVEKPQIRYAGSLLKYSFSEADHRKGVSLVEIDAVGNVKVEQVSLRPRRDVRCITGYLSDILKAEDKQADDYIMVTIKDTGALLDPMGKLRQVYPNILHFERSYLEVNGSITTLRTDHRRQEERQLFSDFFSQVTGQPLSEGESFVLNQLLTDFNRREREA